MHNALGVSVNTFANRFLLTEIVNSNLENKVHDKWSATKKL